MRARVQGGLLAHWDWLPLPLLDTLWDPSTGNTEAAEVWARYTLFSGVCSATPT